MSRAQFVVAPQPAPLPTIPISMHPAWAPNLGVLPFLLWLSHPHWWHHRSPPAVPPKCTPASHVSTPPPLAFLCKPPWPLTQLQEDGFWAHSYPRGLLSTQQPKCCSPSNQKQDPMISLPLQRLSDNIRDDTQTPSCDPASAGSSSPRPTPLPPLDSPATLVLTLCYFLWPSICNAGLSDPGTPSPWSVPQCHLSQRPPLGVPSKRRKPCIGSASLPCLISSTAAADCSLLAHLPRPPVLSTGASPAATAVRA